MRIHLEDDRYYINIYTMEPTEKGEIIGISLGYDGKQRNMRLKKEELFLLFLTHGKLTGKFDKEEQE